MAGGYRFEMIRTLTGRLSMVDDLSRNAGYEQAIWDKLNKTFSVLELLTSSAVAGACRSLIIYGPPGLGKSYTVEKCLEDTGASHSILKGGCTKIGLLRTLYAYRSKGDVIVFDDCDSVLLDQDCISLLKAACDTTENRRISYVSNLVVYPEGDELNPIPSTFEFDGTVIFITNTDFENANKKLQPHCDALVSRSHYIDLQMTSKWDYFVRIKQVVAMGGLKAIGLGEDEIVDVVKYIRENIDSLRELSVRMAIKIGQLRKEMANWRDVADVTCKRVK